ncbi:hypothetical protein [Sneathiella sp. HT1-7]|uniref:hypothetical protein n=1 Tax=Sneathiella sp. HT1-7 TaxID=2887192 RepID=UPI001D141ABA|nr:hypothetical protein [Sneathiella sp. HT1-7]MCC3305889.1 hypothetical protein [Sneathiella sp. HT1-7]
MPFKYKLIGVFGNAVLSAISAVITLILLFTDKFGPASVLLGLTILSGINSYIIWRASQLFSEEEYLKAEIRKEELREQLDEMTGKHAAPDNKTLN